MPLKWTLAPSQRLFPISPSALTRNKLNTSNTTSVGRHPIIVSRTIQTSCLRSRPGAKLYRLLRLQTEQQQETPPFNVGNINNQPAALNHGFTHLNFACDKWPLYRSARLFPKLDRYCAPNFSVPTATVCPVHIATP